MRQQTEALGDHGRLRREAQEVLDDQAKALAPEPMERLKHLLRGPAHPALVHVHGRELAEKRTVRGIPPACMIGHHVIGRIKTQSVPGRQAAGDGGLARTAPAADPVDMPEPFAQHGRRVLADLTHGLHHGAYGVDSRSPAACRHATRSMFSHPLRR